MALTKTNLPSHFCVIPFLHLEIQPTGDVSVCCFSNQPTFLGNLHKQDLMEIWNSEGAQNIRHLFLNGQGTKNSHCQGCFKQEDLGMQSRRMRENENWQHHLESSLKSNGEILTPQSIAIRFSNLCNLACRTCKPATSTAWFQDAKFLNPKGKYFKLSSTPEGKSLTDQVKPLIKTLSHIYFSGGEPLLEQEHYQLLKLVADINPDINVTYDTNLTVLGLGDKSVFEHWPRLNRLFVSASCDGHGAKGEFIRRGFSWKTFLDNWKEVKLRAPNAHQHMNFTLGIYNSFSVLDFLDEVQKLGLFAQIENLDISLVEEPAWQSLPALPPEMKIEVEKRYLNYLDKNPHPHLIRKLKDAIAFMKGSDKSDLLPRFRSFTQKLDILRGEDFPTLFPEEARFLSISALD
jgi:radical SAM protein with 4Fe4S-binding SPASM domain